MKILYNKIYNAINEGIVKSLNNLHIDDDNKPVKYQRNSINNNFDAIMQYINDILNGYCKEDAYQKLKNITDNYISYRVRTFEDLSKIFDALFDMSNEDEPDFSWLNTSDVLTFIMKNDKELSLSEITNRNRKNIKFVKFNNIDDIDHPIIISTDYALVKNDVWESDRIYKKYFNGVKTFDNSECIRQKNDVFNDYNGFEHTYSNVNIKNCNFKYYPALQYVKSLSNRKYKAYLPAVGELVFLDKTDNIFKYIYTWLLEIDYKYKFSTYLHEWLSSTEVDCDGIWVVNKNGCRSFYKDLEKYIIPFFRKIN